MQTTAIGSAGTRPPTTPEEWFVSLLSARGQRVILITSGANMSQRRSAPVAAALLVLFALAFAPRSLHAQPTPAQQPSAQEMLRRIEALEAQIAELKAQLRGAANGLVSAAPAPGDPPAQATPDPAALDMAIGVSLDTYYGYNFNRPVGRVNLLRAYDVTSNNFSLNQASIVVERPADVEAGRRFGGRIDLQYGQATETLQGNLANEPRPWVYRNLFQAYGTYVAPVGRGMIIDFGKWGSSLGYETNYTKDQSNYSRSYWFNFLPFYHAGLRLKYQAADNVTLAYWVTNGT